MSILISELDRPMLDRSEADFRPPAPYPVAERLGLFKLLVRLKRNPLECWSADFFQQPIARVRLPFTDTYLVHDPAAIKRVLMDHAANYPKDPIQRRILVAGLADGLLSVEGARWEAQRRALAPLFSRRTVSQFTQAMLTAAGQFVDKWRKPEVEAHLDVAAEMTLLTLNEIEFSWRSVCTTRYPG